MEFNQHVGMTFEECYKKHRKLIIKLVNKYSGVIKNIHAISKDDIYQVASIGLMEAYKEFDKKYNIKFSTFAYNKIRWHLLTTSRTSSRTISFPQSFGSIWSVAAKYNYSVKDIDKIKKHVPKSISEKRVISAMEWYKNDTPISLDVMNTIENSSEENKTMYEVIKGSESDETVVIVNEFLSELTEKQRKVVILLMNDMNQTEIAKELDISQSQVSRIIKSIQNAWIKEYEGDDE